jgi:starch synthase (maltosyl-transferring)
VHAVLVLRIRVDRRDLVDRHESVWPEKALPPVAAASRLFLSNRLVSQPRRADAKGRDERAGQASKLAEMDGRNRVVIEAVRPEVEGGRFPVKRTIGDAIEIEADILVDGHDLLAARLVHEGGEIPMLPRGNDVYAATITPTRVGLHRFSVEAWIDAFATFRAGFKKKVEAGQDVRVERLDGARLIARAASRASGEEHVVLQNLARDLEEELGSADDRNARLLSERVAEILARHPDRSRATRFSRDVIVRVDTKEARFSAWYEFFPRSFGGFSGSEKMLDYVKDLGFDVVYLPPIHPIGTTFRKGPNNTLTAGKNDPGSPWAIGNKAGGHTAIHPELGTIQDFDRFVKAANARGIEIAIDVAYQASPDHPWVKEHPEWFHQRADGSIQYAENPPKKYQDVYPFAFDGEAWKPLWDALRDVFLFWLDHGVRIFRVDNPHTKPLPFWEWCIAEVKKKEPRAIFLAEAFTRPKLMYGLAKRGFTQSYTYFTWRTTKHDLATYLEHVTEPAIADVFRPNFWPNTPDILPEELQHGGRPAFLRRLVLAATMSSNWGMYGPAFELMEHVARPGSEEYIDNEKFQLKTWDLEREDSLRHVIKRVNRIRREHLALQDMRNVKVQKTDNEQLFAFSKRAGTGEEEDTILVVANLDGVHKHSGFLELDLAALGLAEDETYQVHDLLGDGRWTWRGKRQYVELDPNVMPAQIFHIQRFVRSEAGFEYFL